MRNYEETLALVSLSLDQHHPSLQFDENPVLLGLRSGALSANDGSAALRQYSLLPATIVEFLTIGLDRLREWKDVVAALEKNRGQECGSDTGGHPHYEILVSGAKRELGLDFRDVYATASSDQFLHGIREALWGGSLAFAAGVIYGLESSAVPELEVVAEAINLCVEGMGKPRPLPQAELHDQYRLEVLRRTVPDQYSLRDFFLLHLLHFEVDHRDDLAQVLEQCLTVEQDLEHFFAGSNFVYSSMDMWWDALARQRADEAVRTPITLSAT